jgi:hypothetical protein
MPLFGHRRATPGNTIPAGFTGLAEFTAQGWAPVPNPRPFDGHLEDAVHEISRDMYGAARTTSAVARHGIRVGDTVFPEAFRGTVNGRAVTVANAWTSIGPEVQHRTGDMKGTSVCAVELPSLLPFLCIQPRRLPAVAPIRATPTGNSAFDERFVFNAVPTTGSAGAALTVDVQQRIMAHDDWVFWAERYLLGCVGRGVFRSAEEVGQRISEVLGVVTAIPAAVLPGHVDHSEDDLMRVKDDRRGRLRGA